MPLQLATAPQSRTRLESVLTGAALNLNSVQASTSGGLVIKSASGSTVVTLGPGSGQAAAFSDGISAVGLIQTRPAATQDGIAIQGRAGGTGTYAVTLTPATLDASHTITVPSVTSTMATLAAQTFVGQQIFPAGTAAAPGFGLEADTGFYAYGGNQIGVACGGAPFSFFAATGQYWQSFGGTVVNTLRRANGTEAAPTKVLSGDLLGRLQLGGYYDDGIGGVGFDDNQAWIDALATADWGSATAKPAKLRFFVCTEAGGNAQWGAQLNPGSRWTFGVESDPQATFSGSTVNPRIQMIGTTGLETSAIAQVRFDATGADCPQHILAHAKSNTLANYTAVASGDTLGIWAGEGADGTDLARACSIRALADGTVAADQVPGRWEFYTANASGAETLGLTINHLQSVIVGNAALATTATDGFLYIPTCAGTPTGAPTAVTGRAPLVIDSTNNKLYFYSGGAWRDAGP